MARGLTAGGPPDERPADAPGPPLPRVFGDGGHPTTRLAAAALTEFLPRPRGRARVLDAGAGTGILAEIAAAAGAAVVAIDRDPEAARATRARVPGALVIEGELALLLPALGHFDVVVANIAEPELSALVPALAAALAPGGALLATGVQLWQASRVDRALWAAGLRVDRPRPLLGWALHTAHRPPNE